MEILLLILATLCGGGYSICMAFYTKKTKDNGDAFLYTSFVSLAVLIFFVCYSKFNLRFDGYTLLLSGLFALAYILASAATVYAVKSGPVSLTTIFIAFSLLVPTFFGIIFWKESVDFLFYIGLVLISSSIIFMNLPNKNPGDTKMENTTDNQKTKISLKWIVLVLLAFIGNGACTVIQTYHQKTGGVNFKSEFMVFAMLIVLITNLVISLIINKGKIISKLKYGSMGLIGGVMNAVVNLGVMVLSAGTVIGQSLFFPIISAGEMIVVYAFSIIFFKEKLTLKQNVGAVLGVIAIVLMQI